MRRLAHYPEHRAGLFRGCTAQWRGNAQAHNEKFRSELLLAFVYDAAGVPVSAGVRCRVFGISLSPSIASAALALSSVSVIGNALQRRNVSINHDLGAQTEAPEWGCAVTPA